MNEATILRKHNLKIIKTKNDASFVFIATIQYFAGKTQYLVTAYDEKQARKRMRKKLKKDRDHKFSKIIKTERIPSELAEVRVL